MRRLCDPPDGVCGTKTGCSPSSDLDLNTPRKHTYDTDSSIEQLTPSPAKSAGRRKSKRSRTRSITPPAAKAAHLIALNQDLQTLDAMMQSRGLHRPRQPHVSEIQQEEEIRRMLSAADDELDNDPAIAEAKRRVLARMEAQKTKDGAAARGLPIKFKVAMIFDPRKENASARAKAHFERPFEVEVGSVRATPRRHPTPLSAPHHCSLKSSRQSSTRSGTRHKYLWPRSQ